MKTSGVSDLRSTSSSFEVDYYGDGYVEREENWKELSKCSETYRGEEGLSLRRSRITTGGWWGAVG